MFSVRTTWQISTQSNIPNYLLPFLYPIRSKPRSHKDSGLELNNNSKKASGQRQKPVLHTYSAAICHFTSVLLCLGTLPVVPENSFLCFPSVSFVSWLSAWFHFLCFEIFHLCLTCMWPLVLWVVTLNFDLCPSLHLFSLGALPLGIAYLILDAPLSLECQKLGSQLEPACFWVLRICLLFSLTVHCSKYYRAWLLRNAESRLSSV